MGEPSRSGIEKDLPTVAHCTGCGRGYTYIHHAGGACLACGLPVQPDKVETEGWAERAAERLARNHSVPGALTPLTIRCVKEITLPILRQLEADEAALASIPSVASHARRMDTLASLRALKRSLGVE